MTRAFETGCQQFSWWPDWRGQCVAIIASGPSIKKMDLALLRNRVHVVAIKTSIDLCPWADAVYGCDAAWWIDRKGLPKYHGLKFFHGIAAKQFPGLHHVEIELASDQMLVETPLKIGNGGNSGFQALNIVVQFGATDIILAGFDCHEKGGVHWYGRNTWLNANNPMGTNYVRWKRGFMAAERDLNRLGVTVINASPGSEIKSFPCRPLAEVMNEWGL